MAGRIPFNIIKLIDGTGAQGRVYRAERTDGIEPRDIAVKKVFLDKDNTTAQIKLLDAVLRKILTLDHPNLVRHLDHHYATEITTIDGPAYNRRRAQLGVSAWIDRRGTALIYATPIYSRRYAKLRPSSNIVMEYGAGGSLHVASKFEINAHLVQKWTRQIVLGVACLHKNKIVHRDLKGANILLSSLDYATCVIKIADLGTIKCLLNSMTQPKEVSHGKGTWAYMSPEMILGDAADFNIGRKTDIWSLGCVVLEMISGFPRFVRIVNGKEMDFPTDVAAMCHVGSGGSPIIPDGIPNELKSFVSDCLQRDPACRPGATELLNEPFLTMDEVPQWRDTRPPRVAE